MSPEPEIADRLTDARPIPSAHFRRALREHLSTRDPGYGPRPKRLRLMVGGYLLGGLVLIGFGAGLAL